MVQGMGLDNKDNEKKKKPQDVKRGQNIYVPENQSRKIKHAKSPDKFSIKKTTKKKPKAKVTGEQKPFYKQKWFAGIIIGMISLIIYYIGVHFPLDDEVVDEQPVTQEEQVLSDEEERAIEGDVPVEQINALDTAAVLLQHNVYSRNSLFEALVADGYHSAAASYAVDNVDVDWMAQATAASEDYIVMSAPEYSVEGLRQYLTDLGFTPEEIDQVVDTIGTIEITE